MAGQLTSIVVEAFVTPAEVVGRLSGGFVEVFATGFAAYGRINSAIVEVFLVPDDGPPPPGPPGQGRAPSTFRFSMLGFQPPPPGAYLHGVLAQRSVEYVRQPGSGPAEVRTIRAADVTMPASSTVTIDLELSADPYGARLDLSELVAVFVENVASGAGGTIELRPAASDGITQLLGAGTAVKLAPGTGVVFFVARRDGAGWPVGATTRRLEIVETSGLGAHLVAHVWGRR